MSVIKISYNATTQSFTDKKALNWICCNAAGTQDWSKVGTGWIVIHNTNSPGQKDQQVIAYGSKSKTGGNYYIGRNGDIYQVSEASAAPVSHCGTDPNAFFPKYRKLSNDLLDPKISKIVKTNKNPQDQNLNFFSLGIECITDGFSRISYKQLRALHYLCKALQDKYSQLKEGGITCHGDLMPNTLNAWGEKINCGRLPLGQLKATYKDLTFATFSPTPSNKEDGIERAVEPIRQMIKDEQYKKAEDKISSLKKLLRNAPIIQKLSDELEKSKKPKSTSPETPNTFSEKEFQEVYDSSKKL